VGTSLGTCGTTLPNRGSRLQGAGLSMRALEFVAPITGAAAARLVAAVDSGQATVLEFITAEEGEYSKFVFR